MSIKIYSFPIFVFQLAKMNHWTFYPYLYRFILFYNEGPRILHSSYVWFTFVDGSIESLTCLKYH